MTNNTLLANVLVDLMYQALETEKGGVQIYTTALRLAINKDLREEWNKYLEEAYKHCKTIAASGAGVELLASAGIVTAADEISRTDKLEFRPGLVASREAYVQSLGDQFVKSIARHRHWGREPAL